MSYSWEEMAAEQGALNLERLRAARSFMEDAEKLLLQDPEVVAIARQVYGVLWRGTRGDSHYERDLILLSSALTQTMLRHHEEEKPNER